MEQRQSTPNTENKGSFQRGCGCFLVMIGTLIAALALLTVVLSFVLEKEGEDKNTAEWEQYNANLPVIDSLYEAGVPDSIIQERYPQPNIRQGGFAVIFGGLMALPLLILAVILLIIGIVLRRKYRRNRANDIAGP